MLKIIPAGAFLLASFSAIACDEPHPYFGLNVGKTVNFFGLEPPNKNETAATWEIGYRIPSDKNLSWAIKWHHQSWLTTGSDADESRDTLSIGIEYKIIPER